MPRAASSTSTAAHGIFWRRPLDHERQLNLDFGLVYDPKTHSIFKADAF